MANGFTGMEFDPATGQTKQKQNPYLNQDGNQQGILPYTGQDIEQGNVNVMGAAQTAALNQPAQVQPFQQQTSEMTQKLMTDPNLGRQWDKYNTAQMSAFDADRASAMKAAQEQAQGMGGAGQVQRGLIDMALAQNVDRGLLQNELEQQAYEQSRANYLEALGQGRVQSDFLTQNQQDIINNLLNVRAGYEGQRGQEAAIAEAQRAETSNQTFQREINQMNLSETARQFDISEENAMKRADDLLHFNYDQLSQNDRQFLESLGLDQQKFDLARQEYESSNMRANDELYGYTDYYGNHIAGTLELQNDQQRLNELGMSIQQAQAYGYQKEDGSWVMGSLEANAERLGLDIADYQLRKDQLYGTTDEFGNHVPGALENAASELGLKGKTLALQEKELFGGMVDTNGDGVPDTEVKGKYDLLSEDQKMKADEMYGYYNDDGKYIMGSLEFDQDMARISADMAAKGFKMSAVSNIIDSLPEEQAADIIKMLAIDAGIEYQASDGEGNPMTFVDENGEERPVMVPGLKSYANIPSYGETATIMAKIVPPTDYGSVNADSPLSSVYDKMKLTQNTGTISLDESKQLLSKMKDLVDEGIAIDDQGVESMNVAQWTTEGSNRWKITPEAVEWANDNFNKLYRASNGRLYRVAGIDKPTSLNSSGGIIFTDVITGGAVKLTRGSGFPEA